MTGTIAAPEPLADAVTGVGGGADGDGSPDLVGRRGRFPWGLLVAPFALAAAALLLRWHVMSADKNFQDQSALNWDEKLLPQIREHLTLTGWSTLWVLVIAIPLGILLTRPMLRRFSGPILLVANSGQAIPAYGLFIVFYMWLERGPRTAIAALVVFTVLPVLRNTMVGLDQVPQDVIESARGMGLTRFQVLRRIELPLAVPVILAGVRTALVINVGMAALAVFIGGGGLGITINSGLKLNRNLVTLTGAGVTALLALTVDWLAAVAERVLRPRGL